MLKRPEYFIFIVGFVGGFLLGMFMTMSATAPDRPSFTPEQQMRMMEIYCGKDGCR